jgi:hypothetical protein
VYKIEQKGKMVYAAQLTSKLIKDKDIYAAQILNRNNQKSNSSTGGLKFVLSSFFVVL